MECISSVSYSILINGEPSPPVHQTRGIRQGDPLSLYLFLFCMEGLHSLLQHAADSGQIKGVSICRNGPRLTHLFFADNNLLFCRSSIAKCHKIQVLLSSYESASGQQLNRSKTSLFFSKSTSANSIDQITNYLGVQEVKQYERYLGLPTLVGRNKKANLMFIKERVWVKLQGLKEQLLSQAGREVLLKAVVQAIPTYAISCFKLPITLGNNIEQLIRKFWWGHRGEQRKIHWLKWSTLCLPKDLPWYGVQGTSKI